MSDEVCNDQFLDARLSIINKRLFILTRVVVFLAVVLMALMGFFTLKVMEQSVYLQFLEGQISSVRSIPLCKVD